MRQSPAALRLPSYTVEHGLALLFLALNALVRLWHPGFLPHDFLRGLGAGFGLASIICYGVLLMGMYRRRRAGTQDANTQDANTGT